MKFFKENSYDIIKLYINQIGITIFSLVMYTAINMVDTEDSTARIIRILISVFATAFYCFLLYTAAWDTGAKDRIRIDAGRLECKKGKGALMALWANLPNFLFAGICAIVSYVWMVTEGAAAGSATGIFNILTRFTMSMYLGMVEGIFASLGNTTALSFFVKSIGFFVAPIIAIAATQIGYSLGLAEKKIFSSVSSKKSNK